MQGSRLAALLAALLLTWLLTLWLGAYGPFVAGLLAGRFGPRRGAFFYPALGAFLAWLAWFVVTAATAPLVPLARLLGSIIGIGAVGGLLLPLVASLLCGVAAGLAALAGRAIFAAIHPRAQDSSLAS
jgi:hypothetical protein